MFCKPLRNPSTQLWNRKEELGILDGYRAIVHRIYEKVRDKIKKSEGMSKCFGSDIGVKQGCPLLKAWLSIIEGEGVHLEGYVVKLLLYVVVEDEGKGEKGQACSRPKRSTIDHCVTLRQLIEKIWDKHGVTTY